MQTFNETFIQIIILLATAITITALAKYYRKPYSIALVIVGLFFGLSHFKSLEGINNFLTHSVVFQVIIISIFLPILLGEATLKLPFDQLKENKRPILALAFAGTFLSYLLVSGFSYYILHLPLVVAFVFGSLMAATDPISVLSIFKSTGVNKKLTTIIEGESLFNDGIAVVLFQISSVYLLTYIDMGWSGLAHGILLFLKFAIGGFIVGGVMGYIFSHITKLFDDYPLEISFSIILFFGSYFIAEHFQVSGVIAVAVSGIIFGNYGARIGMTPLTKMTIKTFWDVIALIANSIIFFMVGLEIANINFMGKWPWILFAIIIVIISRSIAVYSSLMFIKLPIRWKHLINWGGLKGSLSIALALSLPQSFSHRDDILVLTFSVVLFSLIIQSLSINPFIKFLKIINVNKGIEEYERVLAHIHRIDKGLEKLEDMRQESLISGQVYNQIKAEREEELDRYHEDLDNLYEEYPEIREDQLHDIKRIIYYTEYDALNDLLSRSIISDHVASKQKRFLVEKIEESDSEH